MNFAVLRLPWSTHLHFPKQRSHTPGVGSERGLESHFGSSQGSAPGTQWGRSRTTVRRPTPSVAKYHTVNTCRVTHLQINPLVNLWVHKHGTHDYLQYPRVGNMPMYGTSILYWYINTVLVHQYCTGTSILYWYINIVLVHRY